MTINRGINLNWFDKSIARKLGRRVIPATLLIMLAVQVLSYQLLKQEILQGLEKELHLTGVQYSRVLMDLFRRFSNDLETLAESPLIPDYYNNVEYQLNEEARAYRREMQKYFANFYERTKLYSGIRYIDANGTTVCSVGSIGNQDHEIGLRYRKIIRDLSGEHKGILELACDLKTIENILGGIRIGQNGGGYLTGPSRVIGRPELAKLSLTAEEPVPGTPWTLVLAADKDEFLRPLQRIQRVILMIAVSGVLLLLVALITGIRRGIAPLEELLEAIRRISSGHLEQTIPVRGTDEIAAVSKAFNEMAQNLLRNKNELQDKIDQLLALQNLNHAILQRADRDAILRTCLESAVRGLHFDRGTLYWVDANRRELVGHCAFNMPGVSDEMMRSRRMPLDRNEILAHVVRSNEPVYVDDPSRDPRCIPSYVNETRTRAFCAAPIRGKQAVLGVIATDNFYTGRPIQPADVESLSLFANSAGMALENTELTGKVHQAQEALIHAEKMSAIGQLIAGIAHEISNPLAAVSGYAQLAMMSDPPQQLRDDLDLIQKSAQRCKKIMDNLLLFARRGKPVRKAACVNEALSNVQELLRYRLERRERVRLSISLDSSSRPVLGDLHQLEQVFLNLINNACDAMQSVAGPKELSVRSRQVGARLLIEVEDNGPGMPPHVVERIFEPFFSTKPAGRGTGLGLAIAKQIIEEHGGILRCHSEPGKGTVFQVELPTATETVPQAKEAAAPLPPCPGKRVLVVDDEPALAAMMAELLRRDRDHVDVAYDGSRALALMASNPYDLIITDLALGEVHGDKIVESWNSSQRNRGAKLMLITGDIFNHSTQELVTRFKASLLPKPFDLTDFQQMARQLLSSQSPSRTA